MSARARKIPNYVKLLCASGAGVSGTLGCYPLDVLRLNMQVSGEKGASREAVTTFQFAKQIIQRDGISGLYSGLTASIARQALYTGTRLGLFQILTDYYSKDGEQLGFLKKCVLGSAAGVCGGVVGLPADVAVTRMAVDKRMPPESRRNYRNVFHAFYRIYKTEGFLTLYRGTVPTIVRAVVVNVSQTVSYFQAKEFLINNKIVSGDNSMCQLASSVISSAVATTCTLPPDITKTRIQNMRVIDGKPEYKNMLDVWYKIVRYEGFFALWKGYTPLFIRNAPQFIITFVAYEKLIDFYLSMHNDE